MAKRIWNPGYVHITLPALTKKYGCYASRLMARRVVWELTREACERPAAAKGTLFSLSSGLKITCCFSLFNAFHSWDEVRQTCKKQKY